MTGDPITQLVTGLQNAARANIEDVSAPYSKLTESIAELLNRENIVKFSSKKNKKNQKTIEMKLVYKQGKPSISGTKRISSQSRRIYLKADKIKPVKQGFGTLVISTSKGVMTGKEAKKMNLGGEPMFIIW